MRHSAFSKFAAGVVAYNLFVILFGAWVRITGSGAGCGDHWPTCNGDVIPRAPELKTIIEFTHRLTSGLSLILVLAVFVWAFRSFAKGHPVRKAALGFVVFILLEAAVGAGLVLFHLVEKDSSAARAIVIAFHLVNTLGLIASGTLASYFAAGPRMRVSIAKPERTLLIGAILIVVVTSATGAITALGDTLFPVASSLPMAERAWDDLSSGSHFLVRLRIIHPVVAICGAVCLTIVARLTRMRSPARVTSVASKALTAFVHTQVLLGFGNILLKAPGFMQLIHLFMANCVWVALVVLVASRIWPAERMAKPA